jgi:hypothetical protein
LTYALLTGLGALGKPPATVIKDGQATVNALIGYVSDQVPRLTEKYHDGRQNPVQSSTGHDFPLAVAPSP